MVKSAYAELEIERDENTRNGTRYAFVACDTGRGREVAKMGNGKTAAEGAAGAEDENCRRAENSACITIILRP